MLDCCCSVLTPAPGLRTNGCIGPRASRASRLETWVGVLIRLDAAPPPSEQVQWLTVRRRSWNPTPCRACHGAGCHPVSRRPSAPVLLYLHALLGEIYRCLAGPHGCIRTSGFAPSLLVFVYPLNNSLPSTVSCSNPLLTTATLECFAGQGRDDGSKGGWSRQQKTAWMLPGVHWRTMVDWVSRAEVVTRDICHRGTAR